MADRQSLLQILQDWGQPIFFGGLGGVVRALVLRVPGWAMLRHVAVGAAAAFVLGDLAWWFVSAQLPLPLGWQPPPGMRRVGWFLSGAVAMTVFERWLGAGKRDE